MNEDELVTRIYKQIIDYLASGDLDQEVIYNWETKYEANVKRLIRSFLSNLPGLEGK